MPDALRLLASLYAGGPDQYMTGDAEGAVIQLTGPDGRPLVSVEAPVLVQVAGEVERLLGAKAARRAGLTGAHRGRPVWWTEVRASTAVPDAAALAGSVAGRLALLLDGVCHPAGAVRSLGVVRVGSRPPARVGPGDGPSEGEGEDEGEGEGEGGGAATVGGSAGDGADVGAEVSAAAAPPGALPAVDVATATTAVVIGDRPLVSLSAWLSDVLRACAETDRALQIVTPPGTRMSMLTRFALTGAPNRWVVGDSSGYYDGLSGAELHWKDGTFAAIPTPEGTGRLADAFRPAGPTADRQLSLSFHTVHPPEEDLLLGGAVEAAWQALTGAPPTGWGTAEPVNLPWSRRQLTDLARGRAPRPTFLAVVGRPERPAVASVRVTRVGGGVEQDVTLVLGYGPGDALPLDRIASLAGTLVAEHGLVTMLAAVRPATRDLTVPAVFEAPPVPVSFTLGAAGVADVTLTRARRPPLEIEPLQLGSSVAPALHYPLGDGTDAEAWQSLHILTEHLAVATP
ncbi:DUF6177 family protein [Streptomyces sp. NPDC087270]|uniref:DUF6177 family protein n=1 Tax=Streptomyces sp. NPDC087270 TaxID=3365774 RepID=UPI0037F26BDC